MFLISAVAESTYQTSYKGKLLSLPVIKYKTLPCMYPPDSIVPCRQVQDEHAQREVILKRAKRSRPQPPTAPAPAKPLPRFGEKLAKYNGMNNKVLDTKFGPMDMAAIEELCNRTRYITVAQRAAAESALPTQKLDPPKTTLETKADMVRLRGQRHEESREEWQDAVLWDSLQSRATHCVKSRPNTPCEDKFLKKRQLTKDLVEDRQHLIRQFVQTEALSDVFVRKCPGYMGYNPLCPPETGLADKKSTPSMSTYISATYRKFPDEVYTKQTVSRRGPLSKTVTLTYPFNPFNKVGHEFLPERCSPIANALGT